jgi:hypothetical protein
MSKLTTLAGAALLASALFATAANAGGYRPYSPPPSRSVVSVDLDVGKSAHGRGGSLVDANVDLLSSNNRRGGAVADVDLSVGSHGRGGSLIAADVDVLKNGRGGSLLSIDANVAKKGRNGGLLGLGIGLGGVGF